MPLSDQLTSLAEILSKLPQKKIAQIISLLLIIYMAYLSAQMTWLLVPQTNQSIGLAHVNNNTANQQAKNTHINTNRIIALNLFGHYQAEEVAVDEPVVKDAPETRLNLTLTGVVASSEKKGGAAIIENAGQQETYGIGEKIKGTRATLAQVMNDRVLIKQAGRLETLMLDGFEYKKVANAPVKKSSRLNAVKAQPSTKAKGKRQRVDLRKNKALTQRMAQLKQDLAKNPNKITDYLKISPERRGGRITGYRLAPGKDKEFFKDAGLRMGDIAIAMNGYDLSEPAQAAQALKALREDTEISLTVDRQGSTSEILFSINK